MRPGSASFDCGKKAIANGEHRGDELLRRSQDLCNFTHHDGLLIALRGISNLVMPESMNDHDQSARAEDTERVIQVIGDFSVGCSKACLRMEF